MPAAPTARYASDIAGKRIRLARSRRGWSIAELAERCADHGAPDLTKSVIGDIERGLRSARYTHGRRLTIEELMVFSDVLAVPLAWLIVPLDASEALAVTTSRVKDSAQALPWITGDAEIPPADWTSLSDEGDIKSWQEARTETMLLRGYLAQMRTIWDLIRSGSDNPAAVTAAATGARALAELMRARGLTPPAAPAEVETAIAGEVT